MHMHQLGSRNHQPIYFYLMHFFIYSTKLVLKSKLMCIISVALKCHKKFECYYVNLEIISQIHPTNLNFYSLALSQNYNSHAALITADAVVNIFNLPVTDTARYFFEFLLYYHLNHLSQSFFFLKKIQLFLSQHVLEAHILPKHNITLKNYIISL